MRSFLFGAAVGLVAMYLYLEGFEPTREAPDLS